MTTQVPPELEDRFARVADSQREADADDEDGQEEPDAAGGRSGKESQATRLVDLGRRTPLFHDPEGNAYATVSMGDHDETWRLRSGGFKSWLAKQYYEREGAIPRSGALQDALTTLEGIARFDGPELAVHLRHAHVDGVLYIDMGDPAWRVIEVSAAGWQVLDEAPVKFRRPRGMQALPEPVRGGGQGIEPLRRFLNITDDDAWRLVVGFLLGCHSKGLYPDRGADAARADHRDPATEPRVLTRRTTAARGSAPGDLPGASPRIAACAPGGEVTRPGQQGELP